MEQKTVQLWFSTIIIPVGVRFQLTAWFSIKENQTNTWLISNSNGIEVKIYWMFIAYDFYRSKGNRKGECWIRCREVVSIFDLIVTFVRFHSNRTISTVFKICSKSINHCFSHQKNQLMSRAFYQEKCILVGKSFVAFVWLWK